MTLLLVFGCLIGGVVAFFYNVLGVVFFGMALLSADAICLKVCEVNQTDK